MGDAHRGLLRWAGAHAEGRHGNRPVVSPRTATGRDPQDTFAPQALLCTDQVATATHMVEWFVLRRQLEVALQEVRTHLGVETPRQWSDLANLRTTPALLGLVSLVTLFAQQLLQEQNRPVE
jgi:hypothetical protein